MSARTRILISASRVLGEGDSRPFRGVGLAGARFISQPHRLGLRRYCVTWLWRGCGEMGMVGGLLLARHPLSPAGELCRGKQLAIVAASHEGSRYPDLASNADNSIWPGSGGSRGLRCPLEAPRDRAKETGERMKASGRPDESGRVYYDRRLRRSFVVPTCNRNVRVKRYIPTCVPSSVSHPLAFSFCSKQ